MQNRTMNRAIKFRGRRLDNGEWITGSPTLIQDADGVWLEDKDLDVVKVDPDTLGQYTGLKDKDGKEIYEGDIVLHFSNKDAEVEYAFVENTSGIDPKHLHYYAVLWNTAEGGFGYALLKEIGMRNPDMCGFNPNLGFLVGNIHDNAERLGRTISSAIRTALERSTEHQTLVFEVGNRETDIAAALLPAELLSPRGRKYTPRKYGRGAFETLFERLVCAIKNGNIPDQLSLLAELDVLQRTLHRKTGTCVLSRTRFLGAVQHWLESKGLGLDTRVRNSYRRNSRHNSNAKA